MVCLQLRKYPGDHHPSHFVVCVDCESGMATVEGVDKVPLGRVEEHLEKLYQSGRRR